MIPQKLMGGHCATADATVPWAGSIPRLRTKWSPCCSNAPEKTEVQLTCQDPGHQEGDTWHSPNCGAIWGGTQEVGVLCSLTPPLAHLN